YESRVPNMGERARQTCWGNVGGTRREPRRKGEAHGEDRTGRLSAAESAGLRETGRCEPRGSGPAGSHGLWRGGEPQRGGGGGGGGGASPPPRGPAVLPRARP